MKITTKWKLNLKTGEVANKVMKAAKYGLTTTVAEIANDAIKDSPFQYGTNRRSIKFEVGPGAPIAQKDLTGAIYSTSGYGGFLETGTVSMPARPYFKPAYDKNIKNLGKNIKDALK